MTQSTLLSCVYFAEDFAKSIRRISTLFIFLHLIFHMLVQNVFLVEICIFYYIYSNTILDGVESVQNYEEFETKDSDVN